MLTILNTTKTRVNPFKIMRKDFKETENCEKCKNGDHSPGFWQVSTFGKGTEIMCGDCALEKVLWATNYNHEVSSYTNPEAKLIVISKRE